MLLGVFSASCVDKICFPAYETHFKWLNKTNAANGTVSLWWRHGKLCENTTVRQQHIETTDANNSTSKGKIYHNVWMKRHSKKHYVKLYLTKNTIYQLTVHPKMATAISECQQMRHISLTQSFQKKIIYEIVITTKMGLYIQITSRKHGPNRRQP